MELKNERFDEKTKEYVYDVEFVDKEEREKWEKLAKENGMEVGQYMSYCLKEFVDKAKTIEQGDNRR